MYKEHVFCRLWKESRRDSWGREAWQWLFFTYSSVKRKEIRVKKIIRPWSIRNNAVITHVAGSDHFDEWWLSRGYFWHVVSSDGLIRVAGKARRFWWEEWLWRRTANLRGTHDQHVLHVFKRARVKQVWIVSYFWALMRIAPLTRCLQTTQYCSRLCT